MPLRPRPDLTAGMAAVELLLIALPLLLTGWGAVEAARWQLARVAVRHALYESARAGATHNADTTIIGQTFERALVPLTGERPTSRRAWRIERISPRTAHFDDFAQVGPDGRRHISNDYQAERHATEMAQGRMQGRGPRSGENIHDANTLLLELTYLHPPLLPGLAALWSRWQPTGDAFIDEGRRTQGALVIRTRVALPMQSAAIEGAPTAFSPSPTLPPGSDAPVSGPVGGPTACTGWWCSSNVQGPSSPWRPSAPSTPPDAPAWTGAPPAQEAPDEACGIILCCATAS